MNVEECYGLLNGDYEDAKSRLMNDNLIEKFMLKFLKDDSMLHLTDALSAEDYEQAFLSAHTLKGVAANLGFSSLRKSVSNLTEQLRHEKVAPDAALVQKVTEDYDCVIEALKKYQDDKR